MNRRALPPRGRPLREERPVPAGGGARGGRGSECAVVTFEIVPQDFIEISDRSMVYDPTEDASSMHRRLQLFRAAIQPLVDQAVYIQSVCLPTMRIGENFYTVDYPEHVQIALANIHRQILEIAARCGLGPRSAFMPID